MLTNLHVKNLALIDEIEVEFTKGLNILTGETGAGKSIIIGSINLALGAKMSKEMIRDHAPYGFVELVFHIENPSIIEKLKKLDIFLEEHQLIISRKLMDGRSISKINGETCTLNQIKEVAHLLLDIHGQHEHQSLLYNHKQLDILDEYAKEQLSAYKQQVKHAYEQYIEKREIYASFDLDEANRLKEISFLEYECKEIEEASIKEEEDVTLEKFYRKMVHSKQVVENMNEVHNNMGYDSRNGVGDLVGQSLKYLHEIANLDDYILNLQHTLLDIDSLVNDFNREVAAYISDLTFSQDEFLEVETRLNLINNLKAKYGNTLHEIQEYDKNNREKLELLYDYEVKKEKANIELQKAILQLDNACAQLSKERKKAALELEKEITLQLTDLNFLNVDFGIDFKKQKEYSKNGYDNISFLISTNPGESKKALDKVVSGGELSRIMLAIKTLLAQKDATETLIFDEIDTGISGRTAQKVSEKMSLVAKSHQVICITHLAQIAAMADKHFEIIKNIEEMETHTRIKPLDEQASIHELARILGGAKITKGILDSAKEMKDLASVQKNTRVK